MQELLPFSHPIDGVGMQEHTFVLLGCSECIEVLCLGANTPVSLSL